MDIKLKYRAWVGEKHAEIASQLTNSDIETFAIEFTEWLVKNCFMPDVMGSGDDLEQCDEPEPCPTCGDIDRMVNPCCKGYDPLHYNNCGYG